LGRSPNGGGGSERGKKRENLMGERGVSVLPGWEEIKFICRRGAKEV